MRIGQHGTSIADKCPWRWCFGTLAESRGRHVARNTTDVRQALFQQPTSRGSRLSPQPHLALFNFFSLFVVSHRATIDCTGTHSSCCSGDRHFSYFFVFFPISHLFFILCQSFSRGCASCLSSVFYRPHWNIPSPHVQFLGWTAFPIS